MNKTNILSLILAITGGILAIGDEIAALPLPGWLTTAWPVVLAAAMSVDRIARIFLKP